MHSVQLYLQGEDSKRPRIFRQTPNNSGIVKNIQFHINKSNDPCDFLVVFAGHDEAINAKIHKNNTLFIAGEPPEIKRYPEAYLAQFGGIICSDTEVPHPNKHLSQQGYPWFCGIQFLKDGTQKSVKNYDDFKAEQPIKKSKTLSVVCSSKCSKPGHRKRFEFVQKLKESFGDELDLFGTGQNPISDKSDAIRPYKYHIAIENSVATDYWSEKLSDCFLEESFPFYAGCPNLQNYFSHESYALIDLDDLDGTIRKIRRAIDENWHQKSIPALRESKERVLDQYNLFNLISNYIEETSITKKAPITQFKAYPAKWFRKGLFFRIRFTLSEKFKSLNRDF
jgi:hypothetical protein